MKAFVRHLGLGALALLLTACASAPKITTNVNPETDFSGFKTYNFASPMGTDRPNGVQTPLTSMAKASLSRAMESRGYTLSDDPDLLVNAYVSTEQRMSVVEVPSDPYLYGYRYGRYNTWGGYTTQVNEYTEGTLILDVIDARKNMLAWEAHAEKRLKSNADPITQERVDSVINQVMAQYPFSAAP